jgi:hypothetical protein
MRAGNVFHLQSWDGSTLGGQWSFACPILDTGWTISDSTDEEGNRHIVGINEFTTGIFTLDGSGPWGGGDPSYSFEISDYHEIIRVFGNDTSYTILSIEGAGHGLLATETYHATIFLHALFRQEIDNTDNDGHHPTDFPAIVNWLCEPGPQYGAWGGVTEIHFEITSIVPVESCTWGRVKSLYRASE